MDHEMNRRLHERDARILAAQYTDDAVIRTALQFDLAIRRAAWWALGLVRADAPRRSLYQR